MKDFKQWERTHVPPELRHVYEMKWECEREIARWHNTRMPTIYLAQEKVNQFNSAMESISMRPYGSHYEYANSNPKAGATPVPKRNTVTVDGIVLSRDTVEKAYAELQKPLPLPAPTFAPGTQVRWPSFTQPYDMFIVASKLVAEAARKAWPAGIDADHVVLIRVKDGECFSTAPHTLVKL